MQTESITHRIKDIKINVMLIRYSLLVLSSYLISVMISGTVWLKYEHIVHTYLDLSYVFFTLSSFIIVFLTNEVNTNSSRLIGFGLLAVAVYGLQHINSNSVLNPMASDSFDTPYIFWMLSRYTESFILLTGSSRSYNLKLNRWFSLLLTAAAIICTFLLVNYISVKLTYFISAGTISGISGIKSGILYFSIFINFAALYFAFKKYKIKQKLKHRYYCIAILFMIQSELCFAMGGQLQTFVIFGHFIKIIYSYHLFMGIFSSAVIHPYESLERTRKMLQESHLELQKILNGLPVAVVTFDSKGRIRFANCMAEKFMECKADELLGKSMEQLDEIFQPDESIAKRFSSFEFKNPGYVYNTIFRLKTKKNNYISLDVTVFKYKAGFMASFTDVKKEQELANLKVQSHTILNAISNSVVIIDNDYKILNCNKAFRQLVELTRQEIVGRNLEELLNAMDFAVSASFSSLKDMNQSREQNKECSLVTFSGIKKEFIFHEAPVVNVDNETIGYAIAFTDITELKKEQRKVIHQEKLAIIGQMGSGIVHETKNYLASIKGYCQLLATKIKEEQLLKYIHKIDNISEDVNKVVVDFLSLAKPTENEVMDVVSLGEILDSMRYMLESPSFMKDVKLVLNLSENEKDIIANESQIKQVVLNMAKNAIEAMNTEQDAILEISTGLSESGKEMMLVISDNGRGISESSLSLLGTPFYTTKDNGTGLGLNVCYRIVKDHGGRIDVKSEEGKGTTFTIYLPCFLKE